jgi:8-oxo-dGTP diphosphatase
VSDDFHGAKLAILAGERIVTILRDDIPTIPRPGHWDLPGGARENGETPAECVLRELEEELGLAWTEDDLAWGTRSPSDPGFVWFFVAEKPRFDPAQVRFGNEGQHWRLAPLDWFMTEAKTIPRHRDRLALYLKDRDSHRPIIGR